MKKTALWGFALAMSIGLCGCQSSPRQAMSAKRILPRDPTFDAIYERLGNPDRITGSLVSYLHYDLKNGQTLTIIVGGDGVVGSEVTERE